MPYKLRKAPKRDLYWVVTIETGKKHSKNPIPLAKAQAQMRILEQQLVGGTIRKNVAQQFIDILEEIPPRPNLENDFRVAYAALPIEDKHAIDLMVQNKSYNEFEILADLLNAGILPEDREKIKNWFYEDCETDEEGAGKGKKRKLKGGMTTDQFQKLIRRFSHYPITLESLIDFLFQFRKFLSPQQITLLKSTQTNPNFRDYSYWELIDFIIKDTHKYIANDSTALTNEKNIEIQDLYFPKIEKLLGFETELPIAPLPRPKKVGKEHVIKRGGLSPAHYQLLHDSLNYIITIPESREIVKTILQLLTPNQRRILQKTIIKFDVLTIDVVKALEILEYTGVTSQEEANSFNNELKNIMITIEETLDLGLPRIGKGKHGGNKFKLIHTLINRLNKVMKLRKSAVNFAEMDSLLGNIKKESESFLASNAPESEKESIRRYLHTVFPLLAKSFSHPSMSKEAIGFGKFPYYAFRELGAILSKKIGDIKPFLEEMYFNTTAEVKQSFDDLAKLITEDQVENFTELLDLLPNAELYRAMRSKLLQYYIPHRSTGIPVLPPTMVSGNPKILEEPKVEPQRERVQLPIALVLKEYFLEEMSIAERIRFLNKQIELQKAGPRGNHPVTLRFIAIIELLRDNMEEYLAHFNEAAASLMKRKGNTELEAKTELYDVLIKKWNASRDLDFKKVLEDTYNFGMTGAGRKCPKCHGYKY